MNKWFGLLMVIVALLLGYWLYKERTATYSINSFEECVAAGNPVMESYPEQCRTKDGKSFSRDIGNELEVASKILINSPRPGEVIKSPVSIAGRARGLWFFEAEFFSQDNRRSGYSIGSGNNESRG